ncbi:hypothetical protein BH23CHL8_BH23CHL8_31270 [soil metagenome]
MSKRTFVSALAALALSTAIAGPALAGPPTYSGTIWCTRDGEPVDMGPNPPASGWTRKQVNEYYRFWVSTGQCDHGSLDLSNMTKDT